MVMVFCKEETFPSPCAPLITDTPLCLATNRDCPVSCTYLSSLGSQHRQVRHAFTTSIQAKRQTPNTKNQIPNLISTLTLHLKSTLNPNLNPSSLPTSWHNCRDNPPCSPPSQSHQSLTRVRDNTI